MIIIKYFWKEHFVLNEIYGLHIIWTYPNSVNVDTGAN